ncbi:MAG: sigma 54-interacting transcriptional regulator [Acidobacteriota bacterium]
MKTLIVEDDPVMQRLLDKILQIRGHEVTICGDAETAWEAYQRDAYQLVLLDWMLPGMNGLQLCRQIRTLPCGDHSVILAITACNKAEDLQQVLKAGADDYLAKPVSIGLLKIRLAIAEQQVQNLTVRKQAEARLSGMLRQLEKSRDDLLSILNQLRIGTAITDQHGCITFFSQAAQRLFGKRQPEVLGKPWEKICALQEQDKTKLQAMFTRPLEQRTKVPLRVEVPGKLHYWVEVEVQDDPRDPQRKIFFFYDMSEVYDLRRQLHAKAHFQNLVGKSEPMSAIYQLIQDISKVDSTVLIEGETGTGKELVARAIHYASHRQDKPFIAVNCAGLTDSLLGSQLFGHRRGAFTGAIEDHAGFFEAANGGTLFLDEIGDIPMNVQTSLLRVLQEKEITRLGETRSRKIDVRVLAATHRNLSEEVTKGNFRADLLYRIRVIRIQIPPLCDRREDIPLLVGSFLGQCRAITGKLVPEVSIEAMRILMEYHWPGNVRELKSAIEFSVIRCKGSVIAPEDLPPEIIDSAYQKPIFNDSKVDEKSQIMAALEQAKGSRTVAARLLGIGRATLYRRLALLKINTA